MVSRKNVSLLLKADLRMYGVGKIEIKEIKHARSQRLKRQCLLIDTGRNARFSHVGSRGISNLLLQRQAGIPFILYLGRGPCGEGIMGAAPSRSIHRIIGGMRGKAGSKRPSRP